MILEFPLSHIYNNIFLPSEKYKPQHVLKLFLIYPKILLIFRLCTWMFSEWPKLSFLLVRDLIFDNFGFHVPFSTHWIQNVKTYILYFWHILGTIFHEEDPKFWNGSSRRFQKSLIYNIFKGLPTSSLNSR